eukprot:jgi/Undpi1/1614/HiC_scaffold_11.g05004.m1
MTRIKHKARAYLEAAIAAQRQPWQGRQQDEEAAAVLALRDRLLNDERSLGNLSPHRRQGETEPRVYHRGGQEHLHDHQHHQHYQQQQQQLQQHQALATPPRHARQFLGPLSPPHRQGETEPRGHDEGGQQQQQQQEQYLNQDQHPPSAPSQPATSSPLSSHRLHGEAEPGEEQEEAHEQRANAVLENKTVVEALESATANSLETMEVVKATMAEACMTVIQRQAENEQQWKKVALTLHTATVQLSAESSALKDDNNNLRLEKRALQRELQDLETKMFDAVHERDLLALKLEQIGSVSLSENIASSNTSSNNNKNDTTTNSNLDSNNSGSSNTGSCNDDSDDGYASRDASKLGAYPATPVSANTLVALSASIAAAVSAAAADLPPPGVSLTSADSAIPTSPTTMVASRTRQQQSPIATTTTTTPASSPRAALHALASLAATTTPLPLPVPATTTTTHASMSPVGLRLLASLAATTTPLTPLVTTAGTEDLMSPVALRFLASLAANATPASLVTTTSTTATPPPTAPSTPTPTISATLATPATPTTVAAPAPFVAPPTPTMVAPTAAPNTPKTPTTPEIPAVAVAPAASASFPTPTITASPNSISPVALRFLASLAAITTPLPGGRAPWVGVGVGGSRFSSPPAASSAEKKNIAARRAAGAARSPLATIPRNTARQAGPSTAAKGSKTTAFVATPGFASLTRETESRKMNKKPAAQVAAPSGETKRASAARSSTRTGMAGSEKAEGMAGRLRSASKTRKDAENSTPFVRGAKKVPSEAAGVSSRTRQAVAARKAAAAGKEVARRRWRF